MADKENPLQKLEEANEKGYLGEVADQTPNENYTVAGVTSDAPTPEKQADTEQADAPAEFPKASRK